MKTNYLFPTKFKKPGILSSIILAILLILYGFGGNIFGKGFIDPISWTHIALDYPQKEQITIAVIMCLLALSLLAAGFSREKDEDEYIAKLRGDSLIISTVINYLLLAVASLVLFDLAFLNFMCFALYLIMVMHIIIFNTVLCKFRRTGSHEE